MATIILASQSPRRRELLEKMGIRDFSIVVPDAEETLVEGLSPQETVERTEQQEAVQKALAALSEEYREVLLLRYMEELDYAEIAEVLQLPSGTVKSRISRAKAALKTALLKSGNIFGGSSVIHTETNGKEA